MMGMGENRAQTSLLPRTGSSWRSMMASWVRATESRASSGWRVYGENGFLSVLIDTRREAIPKATLATRTRVPPFPLAGRDVGEDAGEVDPVMEEGGDQKEEGRRRRPRGFSIPFLSFFLLLFCNYSLSDPATVAGGRNRE